MSTTTSWNVRVDWLDHTGGYNDGDFERILDGLAGMHAALNFEHDEPHSPIRCSATVTVEEATLRQATAAALQAVEAATGEKACGLEVLTTHEFDRQLDHPQIPELVGNADVAEILGVSRQRAAQLGEVAGFPPAVAHIKAGPLRVRSQVEHWASTWERKGGRPRKDA